MHSTSSSAGALTSKPYSFSARSWEIDEVETLDFFDSWGSDLRLDRRGLHIMRVLPYSGWISDRSRFGYDGFRRQRLDTPLIRLCRHTLEPVLRFRPINWHWAYRYMSYILPPSMPSVAWGPYVDSLSLLLVKELWRERGEWRLPPVPSFLDGVTPLLGPSESQIAQADLLLLIGTRFRLELPLLHLRLRRLSRSYLIAHLGSEEGLLGTQLGRRASTFCRLVQGRHPFCRSLVSARSPLIMGGTGLIRRGFVNFFLPASFLVQEEVASVQSLLLGLPPNRVVPSSSSFTLLWLIGADHVEWRTSRFYAVVYQGHHGDRSARSAHLILPTRPPYEREAVPQVDWQGRWRRQRPSLPPFASSREDWQVLLGLALENLSQPEAFNSKQLECRLAKQVPLEQEPPPFFFVPSFCTVPTRFGNNALCPPNRHPFLSDPVSRVSRPLILAARRMVPGCWLVLVFFLKLVRKKCLSMYFMCSPNSWFL